MPKDPNENKQLSLDQQIATTLEVEKEIKLLEESIRIRKEVLNSNTESLERQKELNAELKKELDKKIENGT